MRESNPKLDRFIRQYWIAFGISVVLGALTLWLVLQGTFARIDGAVRGTCARQQHLRDTTNRNSAIIVIDSRIAADAIGGLPGHNDRAVHRLRMVARVPRYLPPVDCAKAVEHPAEYRAPASVPFNRARLEAALSGKRVG